MSDEGATSESRGHSPSSQAAAEVARPAPRPRPMLSRRLFILGAFWTGIMAAIGAAVASTLDFMNPRNVSGFGAPVDVNAARIPAPGEDPVRVAEGRFWLLNLAPDEGGSPGGLLALYQKCPHLGCTVPYSPGFEFAGKKGWFRCPCHGSTFTKEGGLLVSGPSSRDMDTMRIEVKPAGDIVVDTGDITEGGRDNPQRTVAYSGPGGSAPPAPTTTATATPEATPGAAAPSEEAES